jgi:serine/threonine-protein kinase
MELLEGESLSARIKRLSRLDERSAIEIAMQTASGLGAAHAKGIIHRDLKPDNLFVIPEESDAARERVKILDFGIAKLHAMAGDSLKTRTGTLMGTPIYMSPEQCLGTKEVDHRSDIYSLGIIIYEMLAGRTPFISEGFGELLSMHLHEKPESLRAFAPQVTGEVEFAVMRMLAKKPDERYQSMADVRAALAVAAGLPHPLVPEHKLGTTDQFGVRATLAAHAEETKPKTLSPTTLTPGGLEAGELPEITLKVRRKPWTAIGIGSGLIVATLLAAVFLRKGEAPVPAKPTNITQPTPSETPAPPKAPVAVRVRLESTPSGARVVRVSDGAVLGTTPETIELRPSSDPLPLRFEKEGFVAATREASRAADSSLSVVLEAIPEKPGRAPKKHTPAKTHGSPGQDEPAKL